MYGVSRIAKDECGGGSSIIYFCSEMHFYCCEISALCRCTNFLFRSHAPGMLYLVTLLSQFRKYQSSVLSSFIQNNSHIIFQHYFIPDSKSYSSCKTTLSHSFRMLVVALHLTPFVYLLLAPLLSCNGRD